MTRRRGGLEEIVHPGGRARFKRSILRSHAAARAALGANVVEEGEARSFIRRDRPRFKPPLANWPIA